MKYFKLLIFMLLSLAVLGGVIIGDVFYIRFLYYSLEILSEWQTIGILFLSILIISVNLAVIIDITVIAEEILK